ncbi:MAG: hypothetical protein HY904_09735 [Deltaproteobacteria bacterium]|nr:hypothetical protein [Deltaproteobacteria bacterium]
MKPARLAAVAVSAAAAGVLLFLVLRPPSTGSGRNDRPGEGCSTLDRATLEQSLGLGARFMLAAQKPEGNFNYELDWRTGKLNPDDNAVRQAGAAWGLALIHRDACEGRDAVPIPELRAGLLRALAFFERHSATGGEARWVRYPGDAEGQLGTVALVALAEIELLRAAELPGTRCPLDDATRLHHRALLDGYLAHVMRARRPDGRFQNGYALADGSPGGAPSPYSEGESLLAMARAARYLGRRDLLVPLRASADACHDANVVRARAENPDSDVTKGYYQWSSMAYWELATSSWEGTEKYGPWIVDLARWMIDEHDVLSRQRNTGYAYEGIIHAFAWARMAGDTAALPRLGCVIERGLQGLAAWQVGGPRPGLYLRLGSVADPRAVGGVQNHAWEPGLRIDTTQHQMHAVMLALHHYFPDGR